MSRYFKHNIANTTTNDIEYDIINVNDTNTQKKPWVNSIKPDRINENTKKTTKAFVLLLAQLEVKSQRA